MTLNSYLAIAVMIMPKNAVSMPEISVTIQDLKAVHSAKAKVTSVDHK